MKDTTYLTLRAICRVCLLCGLGRKLVSAEKDTAFVWIEIDSNGVKNDFI